MLNARTPLVVAAWLAAGCATTRTLPPVAAPPPAAAVAEAQALAGGPSFDMQGLRAVPRRANTAPPSALTVERWSPDLAAAVRRREASPTAENEVLLGQAYWRHGILDTAYEHFNRAAVLDADEGAAWEGLARIWRDWRFPVFALGNAYRAVSASPASGAAHNTLGTVLLTLGHGEAARRQFEMALALDAPAAYAKNNLCYGWLMEGESERAAAACEDALAADPALASARNNLALARAIAGDLDGAAAIFGAVSGEAAAHYNLGLVHLAQGRYAAAAAAFEKAAALRPDLTMAGARAQQARRHAAEESAKEESREHR
jgi:Flp pilus assembly protein TadD